MRDFEQFVLTVALILMAVFGMGVAGFFLGLGARRRVRVLEETIGRMGAEVAGMSAALQRAGLRPDGSWAGAAPAPAPAPQPDWASRSVQEEAEAVPDAQRQAAAPPPPPPQDTPAPTPPPPAAPPRSLEETIALRWGVWLGAAALLLAGVFLIRYAVEEGLLGPAARCVLAALLGLALIAAGEWLARRPLSKRIAAIRPDHAPPALTAGGVAALFGAAYAASVLYALLPPTVGFALMALAGAAGLLLSLRRGPLVAAVGLAGAYVTPALVQTENPSLPGLFAYLLVVTAAAMLVVRITAWVWLGWCATIAGALWVLIGAALSGDTGLDPWAPALFVPLAAATFLFALPCEALENPLGRRLALVPPAALGLALLPATASSPVIALPIGILLLSPVAILRAREEPRLAELPFIAAGLGLLALWAWALPPWKPTGERIVVEGATFGFIPGPFAPEAITPFLLLAGLLGAAHLLAGLAQERRTAWPLPWAALAASVPVLTLLVAYARVRGFAVDTGWAFAALALSGLLTAAAGAAARGGHGERAGIHAAGAVAALALGIAMVLRDQWLTLAISLMLPPLAFIAARAGLGRLREVAMAVGAVVLVRLLLNRFVAEYDFGATPVLNGLWIAYALPAASFAATAALLLRVRDDLAARAFEGAAVLLAAVFVALQIRHGVQGGTIKGDDWSFAEMALDAGAAGVMALLVHALGRHLSRPVLLWAARALGLAMLGVGALLLVLNPWSMGATVGRLPAANLLLPAYLVPALIAAWAVLRLPELKAAPGWHRAVALYAMAAIFAWTTFEVWGWFHAGGAYRPRRTFQAELWAYSGAWLVLGGVLFWLGIRYASRPLRLAALSVLAVVTFKVFLVDMGALVGLLRVLSFLGLGLALIGLGAVYQRYVLPRPAPPAPTPGGAAAPPA